MMKPVTKVACIDSGQAFPSAFRTSHTQANPQPHNLGYPRLRSSAAGQGTVYDMTFLT